MSQIESSSDSDSNTSSSWIFLDDCSSSNEPDKNKYYLNCSSEPIQELTPQCLNSMDFEQETDSDGISIISESDDTKENTLNDEPPVIENMEHVPVENVVKPLEPMKTKVDYVNKYVVIGWIVVAVMTPLILNYFSSYMQKVVDESEDDRHTDCLKPDLLENNRRSKLSNDFFNDGNMEVIPKHFTNEQCDHHKNTLETKNKQIDSKGEIDVHRLDCQEHQCNQLNIKSKEKEGKKNNGRDKNRFSLRKDDEYEFKQEISPNKYKIGLAEVTPDKLSDEIKKFEKENKMHVEVSFPENNNEIEIIQNKNVKKNKNNLKKKQLDSKSHVSIKKNKHENSQSKTKTQNKKTNKNQETKTNSNKDHFYQREIKKLKKMLEHKEKELKDLTRTVKLKDKHLKMLEYKILKELHALRKSDKTENQTTKKIDDSLKNKLNSTSGEWYHKLHKGRSKFRNQQYASDWVFDRADFRNKKRNMKNNWYWNWMSDREQLRLKRGLWHCTY